MAERQPDSGHAARKQTVIKEVISSPYSTEKGDNLTKLLLLLFILFI